jgi:hypothetical protein
VSLRRATCLIAPALVVGALLLASSASAGLIGGPAPTVWLCKPGQANDPCRDSLKSTTLLAGGSQRAQKTPSTPAKPPVDCFYVYPTVSQQPTGNSTLEVTGAETGVARAQASRFQTKCRIFAPMYRQATLAGIFGRATTPVDRELGYSDVKAAWSEYLSRYNKGRGVIFIGHSQGTGVLTRLIAEEVDPNAKLRKRLVSALLIGGGVLVPLGRDVGGSFQKIPACRKSSQHGCVVAYNVFPSQPPADARFGRTLQPGREVLCTNPAALKKGRSGLAQTYVPTSQLSLGAPIAPTPWVHMDGEYTVRCQSGGGASWLNASHNGGSADKRPQFTESLGPTWGFHIVDINIALGNLVDLAGRQSAAWRN